MQVYIRFSIKIFPFILVILFSFSFRHKHTHATTVLIYNVWDVQPSNSPHCAKARRGITQDKKEDTMRKKRNYETANQKLLHKT